MILPKSKTADVKLGEEKMNNQSEAPNQQSEVAKSAINGPNSEIIRVLLIEDNPGDARLIKEMITKASPAQFELRHTERLSEGLRCLREEHFDAVLLDLLLPDATGFETFVKAHAQAPATPIIVLTGLDIEMLGVKAVREGAQDYLAKEGLDGRLLARAIQYAIERHRMKLELRAVVLVDELTGLYNRRGFLTLSEQHLKLANRTNRGFLLAFADVDDLKKINDAFGHNEGDLALIDAAEILKKTFRHSDIIARIGGDEFAIIAIEANNEDMEIISNRLLEKVETRNAMTNSNYKISISLGMTHYDPEYPCSIDELLSRADSLMYANKLTKKTSK
jgi:diguanylate cyclase (GGDEF)-like protein